MPPPLRPEPGFRIGANDSMSEIEAMREDIRAWRREKLAYDVQVLKAGASAPRPTAEVVADMATARTAPEVAEILQAQLASSGISVVGISRAASVDTARKFGETVLDMLDRFPTARLHEIGYETMKANAYAHATFSTTTGRTGLYLNTRYGTKARRDELLASLANDEATGFHPPGTGSVRGIIAHEFGHVLDYTTDARAREQVIPIVNDYVTGELGIERFSPEAGAWRRDNLPGYSMHRGGGINSAEALAEAFSDVALNGDAALPLHTRIVDELLRRLPQ